MSEIDPSSVAADYHQFVPFTARMMAAIRAIESERTDRLFADPFAALLAGEQAFASVAAQLSAQDRAYVAVRTHFFDRFFSLHPASQVVILASGLDTRPYRLDWNTGVKIYELDRAEVIASKTQMLQNVKPQCELHSIPADLTQPWQSKLLDAGYNPEVPSVWLIEGLLMYLSATEVQNLLATVSSSCARDSYLGLDLINVSSLDYAPYRGYFQFGCDRPAELLSASGWQAVVMEPGDEGANFGRYPRSLEPKSDPSVQRAFLVTAVKL
jgi:methyltransferase (TIGR00027 family)